MSIRGSNFENQHPFASDHALVWERCMPDGLLYGVDMSFTSTLFTLGTGFMLVAGRMFEITAAENISISPGSGYARVYVAIDTGGTASENSFDQVSFGVDYAANLDSFPELIQGEININQGAAVYQGEVAVLAINSSGVTAIERQIELVSPGAGTGAFAAIAVTYPAGSTVTVTDSKITYTAPNTNGSALFIIPYAATWIVTATDGTHTNSKSVEITTEGQSVSVNLGYNVILFDGSNGGDNTDATGGWNISYRESLRATVTEKALVSTGNFDYVRSNFQSVNKFNLDSYSVLRASFTKTSATNPSSVKRAIGINTAELSGNAGNTINQASDFMTNFAVLSNAQSKPFELELDISNIDGEHFINVYFGSISESCYKVELLA